VASPVPYVVQGAM